jgi:hypothetical protein
MTSRKRYFYPAAWMCCFLAWPMTAQEEIPKPRRNGIFIGGGAAVPGGDLRSYMSTSALFHIDYSYRFLKHFQADVSFIPVFNAAGINFSLPTFTGDVKTGDVNVSDTEYLVPFGGRAILPVAGGRFELFGGGGALFLHYAEETSGKQEACIALSGLPSTCTVDQACPQCTSRGGWGSYGLAGAGFALDRRRRFWIEVETRFVRGRTSGKLLGSGAGFETRDQWLSTAMNVGYRF